MASSRSVLAALVLPLSGCGASSLPAPRIAAVSPDLGWTDLGVTVDVTGENFASGIVPDADDPEASPVERASLELVSEDGDVVLVLGSYLGPTGLRMAFAPDDLAPARYDVRVVNPDGSADVAPLSLWMRGPPVAVRFEPVPATMVSTSAGATIQTTLLDAGGDPTPLRAGESFVADLLNGSGTAVLGAPSISIAALGSAGTVSLRNTVAETVVIGLDPSDLAASGVSQSGADASVQFTPAPTVRVRIPDAAEVAPTDNFAVTEVRLEDVFGNLSPRSASYSVQLDAGSGTCIGWTITPSDIVVLPAGQGSASITVGCPGNNQDAIVTVVIQDAGALPPLDVSTVGVMDFTTP